MDVEVDWKGRRVAWRGGGLSKHRRRLSVAASSRRDLTLPSPAAAALCVPKHCGSTRGFGPVFPPPTSSFSYWGGGRRPWGPVWESPLKSVGRDTPLKIFWRLCCYVLIIFIISSLWGGGLFKSSLKWMWIRNGVIGILAKMSNPSWSSHIWTFS